MPPITMVGQKLHKYQEQWRSSGYMNCCAAKGDQYEPTTVEQVANILTHGVSILPAISCVYDLLKRAGSSQLHHNVAILYGTSFVMLFAVRNGFSSPYRKSSNKISPYLISIKFFIFA